MGFISCSKDEPNLDPTDDGTVTVSADGTTSNGMQFRRIDETHFMLNYVKYIIDDGHLRVDDCDEIEVKTSLQGKVTIVPAVILDGTKYYTREVGGFSYSKLKEIEIPNTVTKIGCYAFESSALEAIRIPEGVKEIGKGAFEECTSLMSVELKEGLETLGSGAFYGCHKLKAIRIPKSVKIIGGGAFYQCFFLSSVELNEGLETLGSSAFYGCSKLGKISIPENVSIYYDAFHYVPLKELRLPGTIKIEGGDGFSEIVFNSKEIKDIYVNSKIPIKPEGKYYKLFKDIILYEAYLHVPKGSSDLYKESPFWGKFKHIVEYNPE